MFYLFTCDVTSVCVSGGGWWTVYVCTRLHMSFPLSDSFTELQRWNCPFACQRRRHNKRRV